MLRKPHRQRDWSSRAEFQKYPTILDFSIVLPCEKNRSLESLCTKPVSVQANRKLSMVSYLRLGRQGRFRLLVIYQRQLA